MSLNSKSRKGVNNTWMMRSETTSKGGFSFLFDLHTADHNAASCSTAVRFHDTISSQQDRQLQEAITRSLFPEI